MQNKGLRDKYKHDFGIARKLVNEFDPCGFIDAGAQENEYDGLTNQLLSLVYVHKTKTEIKDFFLNQIEQYYGTPDLTVLEEPYKSKYFSDLEKLVDNLLTEIGKTNS